MNYISELEKLIKEHVNSLVDEDFAEPGEHWKTKSGKWAGKNRDGDIDYFDDEMTASRYAAGIVPKAGPPHRDFDQAAKEKGVSRGFRGKPEIPISTSKPVDMRNLAHWHDQLSQYNDYQQSSVAKKGDETFKRLIKKAGSTDGVLRSLNNALRYDVPNGMDKQLIQLMMGYIWKKYGEVKPGAIDAFDSDVAGGKGEFKIDRDTEKTHAQQVSGDKFRSKFGLSKQNLIDAASKRKRIQGLRIDYDPIQDIVTVKGQHDDLDFTSPHQQVPPSND